MQSPYQAARTFPSPNSSGNERFLLREKIESTYYGYNARIQSDEGKWYALPNTCLRKDDITHPQASADFIAACTGVGAKWEKYIAAEYTSASFNNQ